MFGSSKIRELEKRIERLEYKNPESLESFYNSKKYIKIDNLYWLDREWFINELNRHGLFLAKTGYLFWTLGLQHKTWETGLISGSFVGEIYEGYIALKESIHPQSKEIKKKK